MDIQLKILDTSGHRTVTFDAGSEEGGKKLEAEVAELTEKGVAVLVTFPGQETPYPVVAYDAENNAWITRGEPQQTLPAAQSSATAVAPIVGG